MPATNFSSAHCTDALLPTGYSQDSNLDNTMKSKSKNKKKTLTVKTASVNQATLMKKPVITPAQGPAWGVIDSTVSSRFRVRKEDKADNAEPTSSSSIEEPSEAISESPSLTPITKIHTALDTTPSLKLVMVVILIPALIGLLTYTAVVFYLGQNLLHSEQSVSDRTFNGDHVSVARPQASKPSAPKRAAHAPKAVTSPIESVPKIASPAIDRPSAIGATPEKEAVAPIEEDDLVVITLSGVPKAAAIRVNGAPSGKRFTTPRSSKPLKIEVQLLGYKTVVRRVVPRQNKVLQIQMAAQ
jgi:hypothetical protein